MRVAFLSALVLLAPGLAFAKDGGDAPMLPNVCGYSSARELMDSIHEKWWDMNAADFTGETRELRREAVLLMPKLEAITKDDTTTVVEVPGLLKELDKLRETLKSVEGPKKESALKLLKHLDKIRAMIVK